MLKDKCALVRRLYNVSAPLWFRAEAHTHSFNGRFPYQKLSAFIVLLVVNPRNMGFLS